MGAWYLHHLLPTGRLGAWEEEREAQLYQIKVNSKEGTKVQWFSPPSFRAEPREPPFWVVTALELGPSGSVAIGVSGVAQGPTMQGRDLWQGEPAVLPAALQQ